MRKIKNAPLVYSVQKIKEIYAFNSTLSAFSMSFQCLCLKIEISLANVIQSRAGTRFYSESLILTIFNVLNHVHYRISCGNTARLMYMHHTYNVCLHICNAGDVPKRRRRDRKE